MGLNPQLLAENPELAMLRLQRQRTMKMVAAAVAVVALVAGTLFLVTIAYHEGPEAAQQRSLVR